jgi:protein-L-isoaspartate(D-aspartate) O-methyltransferase
LVDKIIAQRAELNAVLSSEVEAALRTVPRHLFAPGVPWETAYTNDTVVTKRDEHGIALSSVSAPWLQAMMLEQAQLAPGMRVLEIGSGGYNAALIAELVGEEGEVTTVDIDSDVADRARRCLAVAGYRWVNVVLADAEGGIPDHAPYDRIIVTVGAWDIPPAWVDQLAEGGRLVRKTPCWHLRYQHAGEPGRTAHLPRRLDRHVRLSRYGTGRPRPRRNTPQRRASRPHPPRDLPLEPDRPALRNPEHPRARGQSSNPGRLTNARDPIRAARPKRLRRAVGGARRAKQPGGEWAVRPAPTSDQIMNSARLRW